MLAVENLEAVAVTTRPEQCRARTWTRMAETGDARATMPARAQPMGVGRACFAWLPTTTSSSVRYFDADAMGLIRDSVS